MVMGFQHFSCEVGSEILPQLSLMVYRLIALFTFQVSFSSGDGKLRRKEHLGHQQL